MTETEKEQALHDAEQVLYILSNEYRIAERMVKGAEQAQEKASQRLCDAKRELYYLTFEKNRRRDAKDRAYQAYHKAWLALEQTKADKPAGAEKIFQEVIL